MNKPAYFDWLKFHFTNIVSLSTTFGRRQWFTVRDLRRAIANREDKADLHDAITAAQRVYRQQVCGRRDRSINWMFYEFSDRIQRALNALVRQGVLVREIDKQYTRQDGWSDHSSHGWSDRRTITVTRYRYRFA